MLEKLMACLDRTFPITKISQSRIWGLIQYVAALMNILARRSLNSILLRSLCATTSFRGRPHSNPCDKRPQSASESSCFAFSDRRHKQATCNDYPDCWKSASELRLQLLSEHLNLKIETPGPTLARSEQSSLRKTLAWFAPSYLLLYTPFLELRPSTSTLTQ
jgi:hypothetical protein